MKKRLQQTTYCEPRATVMDLHLDTHLCQGSESDTVLPGSLPDGNLFFEDFNIL